MSLILISVVPCQDTAHGGSRSWGKNWKHFLHVGRCSAKKLLIEPDSRRINNIRGSAHTRTPNKGEDKVVKVRAITRQIQIKDIVFNLQDTKIFFESSQCLGEEGGKEGGRGAVSTAKTFLMVSVTFCGKIILEKREDFETIRKGLAKRYFALGKTSHGA